MTSPCPFTREPILEPIIRELIAGVVEYAEEYPISIVELERLLVGTNPVPGDDFERACTIPRGFRCCFSIEEHPPGWHKHLSVSLGIPLGGYPNDVAMNALLQAFGMESLDSPSFHY